MSNLQHHDHAGDLQRKLTNRHLQLIAIGGHWNRPVYGVGQNYFIGGAINFIYLFNYWHHDFLSYACFGRGFTFKPKL